MPVADLRALGGDHDVTAQKPLHAASDGDAVHRCDHRYGQVLDHLQDVLVVAQQVEQRLLVGCQRFLELDQVAAGAEGAPRAGEHHGAQARKLRKGLQPLLQRCHHLVGQRVEAPGPVHCQRRDCAVDGQGYGVAFLLGGPDDIGLRQGFQRDLQVCESVRRSTVHKNIHRRIPTAVERDVHLGRGGGAAEPRDLKRGPISAGS